MAYIGKQPGTGVRNRFLYTATAGQTTFTTSDSNLALSYSDALYMDVYLNGVLLDPANDYTATSGTSVVLGSGASAGDILEVIVYDVFSVFNNTIDGNFEVGGDLTVDTNTLVVDSTNNRVGFGTTSPAAPVDSVSNTNGVSLRVRARSSDEFGLIEFVENDGSTAHGYIGTPAADTLAFYTNGLNERMRINSSGNVGVGTATPAQPFHVKGGAVQFENTQNTYLQVNTTDTHLYTAGAHPLRLGTNSTERLRILSSGGLTFNGDTADANALDDYEEGSWTPTYVSTGGDLVVAGYSSQFGRYVKIGKMCQVNGAVQTSGITTTGTGDVRIDGLPFNIANISDGFIAGTVGYSQNFVTVNPQTVLGMPNTSQLTMRYNVGTGARTAITGNMQTSNLSGTNNHNYIIFSITYTVSG
jgi:hypothetical protein